MGLGARSRQIFVEKCGTEIDPEPPKHFCPSARQRRSRTLLESLRNAEPMDTDLSMTGAAVDALSS